MKRRGPATPPKYVVRNGDYYFQGTTGWGQRSRANVYDDEYAAEKVASTLRKRGIVANARAVPQ